jgi:hypothetical protein
MALKDLWDTSRGELETKQLHQIISIAGEGRLADGAVASMEFRDLLASVGSSHLIRFAEEALAGGFEDSGFALQDVVNEIGKRLGFRVEAGRYRGTHGQIGFDGLWRASGGESLVVEVKTTDAYQIHLNTVADYRKNLIRAGTLAEETSSILIVLGRQNTVDLEAQIRGSRHAWDVRLISVDSLLRLLKIKESVDDPAIVKKITQILVPQEFTRVDGIIDVVFSAAEEEENEEEEDEKEEPPQPAGKKGAPASFHEACIARLEKHLRQTLVKQTRSMYATPNGETALVCPISRQYEARDRRDRGYWFTFHRYYQDYLAKRQHAFVAFGCGSSDLILVIPFRDFEPWLDGMDFNHRGKRFCWFVRIHETSGKLQLLRKAGLPPVDLEEYRI